MGVVTVSSSSARTPFGLYIKCSSRPSWYRRPVIVSFKADNNTPLAAPGESAGASLPLDVNIKSVKKIRKVKKRSEKVHAVSTDVASLSALELDYNEAAAKLEHIFETSPTADALDEEGKPEVLKRKRQQRKTVGGQTEEKKKKRSSTQNIVRSPSKEGKRLSLEMRIAQKTKKEGECSASAGAGGARHGKNVVAEKINRLVRDYSVSTELVSLDWKKMKIPPVLPSSEHAWLFKLMQPAKELLKVKKTLYSDLGREPTDYELAEATYMDAIQLRKQLEVGRAARNKLIKHNLRLILFVMNKYFHDFLNGPKFQDLCQAGVKGLITAIDRFEPKRKLKLSTYGLFWIRHAIVRSMTLLSFTKVSFGIDSVKAEIQKSKLQLLVKLQRSPTHEEIMDHVGMSPERYYEVLKVSKPVFSLNAKNELTQEEFINVISDVDDADVDRRRKHALLRLALDDVLDSLKPKESLVIRQRYGLDGRGDRTLGEIAGNLNISREMVRKHEVKALMKLKHPARVDYLRHYIFK